MYPPPPKCPDWSVVRAPAFAPIGGVWLEDRSGGVWLEDRSGGVRLDDRSGGVLLKTQVGLEEEEMTRSQNMTSCTRPSPSCSQASSKHCIHVDSQVLGNLTTYRRALVEAVALVVGPVEEEAVVLHCS